MTCQELSDILFEFLNDELDPSQSATIHSHLEACPHCVHFVATYQITIEVSRRLPVAPLPPELVERLQRALADETSS